LAMACIGDIARAGKLADRLKVDFPSATLIQNYWLPTIRAEMARQAGKAGNAIEILRAAGPYELSSEAPMLPAYVRAAAYLTAHQDDAAATEFQKILQHRGVVGNHVVSALAQLGLARAYAGKGDTARARTAFRRFLTLWNEADRNVPILERARVEFANIKETD
jgi:eukaryotic-like serine/threonine-protein kinase